MLFIFFFFFYFSFFCSVALVGINYFSVMFAYFLFAFLFVCCLFVLLERIDEKQL